MKYLFDTNVIIDHLRGKRKLDSEKMQTGVAISIITYGELLYGAEKSTHKEKSHEIIQHFLEDLSIKIIPLSEKEMKEYAKLKASLEAKGSKLDDFDVLIAVTALTNKLQLITRNINHFGRIKGLLR